VGKVFRYRCTVCTNTYQRFHTREKHILGAHPGKALPGRRESRSVVNVQGEDVHDSGDDVGSDEDPVA
jgi:hypothetical protein